MAAGGCGFTQLLLLGNLIAVTCLIATLWNKAESDISTMLTTEKSFFLPPTIETDSDKKYPLIPINEEGSRRAEGMSKRTTENGSVNTKAPDIGRTESGGFYPGGVTYYVNPRQGERDFYAIGNTYQTAR
jgi:hypothetical protein